MQIDELMSANEGMRSRFKRTLEFKDWDCDAVLALITKTVRYSSA